MKTKFTTLFLVITFLILTNNSKAYMYWNQACQFAGGGQYIAIPNSPTLNITGSFSIEMWVYPMNVLSPANQMLMEKTNASGNGYNLYLKNGKVVIATNGTNILIGKVSLQNNTWTHISVSYNTVTDTGKIFLNSVKDTSAKIIAAEPNASVDTMRVGLSRHDIMISPFAGYEDEIRLWNKALSREEVLYNFRLSLSGSQNLLSISLTFQNKKATGVLFSLTDMSGNNNNALNKGVTALDLSNRPSNTIIQNNYVNFEGTNYLSGPDNPDISPTTGITIEAWIRTLDTTSYSQVIVHKGTPAGPANYGLRINYGYTVAVINGMNFPFYNYEINNNRRDIGREENTDAIQRTEFYSYMAFTYNANLQKAAYYCDGVLMREESIAVGLIIDGPDNLYIGGTPNGNNYTGRLDEIRISNYPKTSSEIANSKYISIDKSNEPNPGMTNVCYNFDGTLSDNCDNGPDLLFSGSPMWGWNSSPILRFDQSNFSNAFYIGNVQKRIPLTGITGIFADTLTGNFDAAITDLDVFISIEHSKIEELKISLISPLGTEVILAQNETLLQGTCESMVTIFDDGADSSMNGQHVSFSPSVKPRNSLSGISGQTANGLWRLKVEDQFGPGTGKIYGWGIRINNGAQRISTLKFSHYVQGFYNPSANLMIPDTARVTVRSGISPYSIIGSNKKLINNLGVGNFVFPPAVTSGQNYYLEIEHRNSIEIWSASHVQFDDFNGILEWIGNSTSSQTYGNNVIQIDTSPVRYGIFSGDVNQDGTIDLADGSLIDNDAFNFVSGYVPADVNGDEIVDVADAVFADNNGFNFVSKITP